MIPLNSKLTLTSGSGSDLNDLQDYGQHLKVTGSIQKVEKDRRRNHTLYR